MPDVFLRSVPSDADRDDVRLYDPTTADASGVIGVASQSIDAFTQASPAKLIIKGQSSASIGSVTQASPAKLVIQAVASQTIGSITQSAPSKVLIKTTVTQTFGAVTQVAPAKLLIKSTVAQTLGAVTQVAPATISTGGVLTASSSQTIGAFTQAAPATMSQPPAVQPSNVVSPGAIGGSAHWYRGKYRGELRRTILAAAKMLPKTQDAKKKKRAIRKVAEFVHASPTLAETMAQVVPPDLIVLERIRVRIADIAANLDGVEGEIKYTDQLHALFEQYQAEVKRLERDEEEAIAVILSIAA